MIGLTVATVTLLSAFWLRDNNALVACSAHFALNGHYEKAKALA